MKMQPKPGGVPCPRCGKLLPEIECDGVVECRGAKCGRRVAIVWMPLGEQHFHVMTAEERTVLNRRKWRG